MLKDVTIRKLLASPPLKRTETPDGQITGLYFVLQPTGAASWALRYRVAGRPTKLTIGPYPALTLAAARRRAQEALGDVAGGKDPARAKQAARAAAKAESEAEEDRVDRVVALFVERYAKPKNRDWKETARLLNKEILTRWKGRRLSQITRANVNTLLDDIVDKGAPIGANRTFSAFRKLCKWSIGRGIIEHSPCDGVTAPSPENRRDRVLDDAEIRLVWEAASAIGWPFGPVIKMLILTGQRRDEVAGMRWSEVDLQARTWTLPAARAKNKHTHQIPLSDAAIEILRAMPRHEKVDVIFTTNSRTPVSGWSRMKLSLDAHIAERIREEAEARGATPKAMPEWTLHDIRRSLATNLQRLGVRLEVTEAVLNHRSGSRAGIVGVYQQHDWADEKRQALDAWSRRLDAIVTGASASNVVELATGRGR
jgi:integrase